MIYGRFNLKTRSYSNTYQVIYKFTWLKGYCYQGEGYNGNLSFKFLLKNCCLYI